MVRFFLMRTQTYVYGETHPYKTTDFNVFLLSYTECVQLQTLNPAGILYGSVHPHGRINRSDFPHTIPLSCVVVVPVFL